MRSKSPEEASLALIEALEAFTPEALEAFKKLTGYAENKGGQ